MSPKDEPATERIGIRCTQAEKELFQKAADADNRTLTGWILDRCLKAAEVEVSAISESATKKKRAKRL